MAARDGLLPPLVPHLQPRLPRARHRAHHHGLRRAAQQDGRDAVPALRLHLPDRVLRDHAGSAGWWRWLLLLYPVAMSLTLIYSAEHYLIDSIMGGVIAALAMVIGAWWDRWRPPATVLSGTSPAPRP